MNRSKVTAQLAREMRRWANDTAADVRDQEPDKLSFVVAISSEIDYAYSLIIRPGKRAFKKWDGPFGANEQRLGRMAECVWGRDASAVVYLSHWPEKGDFHTMNLGAPGRLSGDVDDPQSHWLLNLLCLTGVLEPVNSDGSPLTEEQSAAIHDREEREMRGDAAHA